MTTSIDANKEQFREYLDKQGVVDSLTKGKKDDFVL
jgi:hypothetical protein